MPKYVVLKKLNNEKVAPVTNITAVQGLRTELDERITSDVVTGNIEAISVPSNYYTKDEINSLINTGGSGGGGVIIDSALSGSSTNPVQNKVIKVALDNKQDVISDLSTIRSNAQLATSALQSFTETDPTVPAWAKQVNKPSYTATEVGALSSDTIIPSALSDLTDDSTHRVVTDNEKTTWSGKQDALVSGTNIKTINGTSLLGSGDITISGGGSGDTNIIEVVKVNGTALTPDNNKAVDVTIPTQLSDLTDDTSHRLVTDTEKSTWNNKYDKPLNGIPASDLESGIIPIIPTNVSDFVNDANYLTSHQDISTKADKVNNSTNGNFAGLDSNGNLIDSGKKASDFQSVIDANNKLDYSLIDNTPTIPTVTVTDVTVNGASVVNNGTAVIPVIPTNVSAFTNDANYLTQHQDITGKQDVITAQNKLDYSLIDNTPTIPDITGKADKVSGGTTDNFAALDASGNLKDSGHNHSDYLTSHQDISGKADKVSNAVNGNFAALDSNGNLTDSGSNASTFLTSHQDVSGKADKTTITTSSASTGSITLTDNNEYRFTASALTSLAIDLPVSIGDNLDCWIAFNSGSTATSTTYPNTIKWSGDDVSNNVFVPLASKTYNIGIWYDGINVNAVTRGV